jgi:hypothetical protein
MQCRPHDGIHLLRTDEPRTSGPWRIVHESPDTPRREPCAPLKDRGTGHAEFPRNRLVGLPGRRGPPDLSAHDDALFGRSGPEIALERSSLFVTNLEWAGSS